MTQSNMVVAGSPAAILARQQKLAGSARRQLQMNHVATPVSTQLDAPKPELRPRLQIQRRAAVKPFHIQQQASQMMEPPSTEPAPQYNAWSEDGEIFLGAVQEVAEEAAASKDLADTDSDSAVGGAAITDSQQVAADKHAAGSTAAQTATADTVSAAVTAADAESATKSANDESVGALNQHAAASAAAEHDAGMPVALLLSDEASEGSATAEASVQQDLCHVPPAGSNTQEGCGRQYPWMEAADQTSASSANTEQLAQRAGAESAMQQPHVTFATGAMACSGPSKIPMRYLAAAAADRRSAAQEAAAAACMEADKASVAKPAAKVEAAAGTDAENVMQDVVVSWAGDADGVEHIQQAAEQDWTQNDGAVEQFHAAAPLPLPEPASTLSAFQPSSSFRAEPENATYGMPRDVPGNAEEGGLEAGSEGNEQSDSVSVTSFANSAASGLGHLLRAQQPSSESSSSPDGTSTTGSAEVRDISQLEAEVISQPTNEPPQEVLLSDQNAGLGSQLPMPLLLSHGQEQHVDAQPVPTRDQAQVMAYETQENQQREGQGGDQAESYAKAWSLPSHASSTEAGTPVVGYATGKQITHSLTLLSIDAMPTCPVHYAHIA